MTKVIDLVLDADDTQCLVRGGILTINFFAQGIKQTIRLDKNINFSDIYNMTNRAEDKKEEPFQPHEKDIV